MVRHLLAGGALAAMIATGALAQQATGTTTDLSNDPAAAVLEEREGYPLEEGWTRLDAVGTSADELMGEDIVNLEGEELATIDDIVVGTNGEVEGVVATFGGFLGFGTNRVLLSMEEIDVVRDRNDDLIVRSTLTPEALEGRPEYEG